MSLALPLDLILGPQQAGALLRERADELTLQFGLSSSTALGFVCERALDGDPLILAAPGQVWALNPGEDDAPAQRLTITARLNHPPRVHVVGDDGVEDELPLEALEMYHLLGAEAG
jgi:hypothetical protein